MSPALLATLREGIPRVKTIDEDAAWTQAIYEEVVREPRVHATVESGSAARSSGEGQPPHAGYEAGPAIAAVVLNYNTPDDTLLAVLSLRASRRPLDQLIVVDNGPGEDCERALSPWKDSLGYIRSPGNVGFSGGCNIGIRAALDAGADMVLLVNSDAVLAPDAVERLEHALQAEPRAGMAAPLVVSRAEPGIVGSAGIAYSAATGRMRHEGFGSRTEDLCEGPARETDVVSGCVMLIRRSVFDAVGLFDERYFYSFEDIEFCLRARRAGHRILLVPQALAYHEGHQSIGAASASRLYYAARNHLLLAQSALPLTGLRACRPRRRYRAAECGLCAARARHAEAGGTPGGIAGVGDHVRADTDGSLTLTARPPTARASQPADDVSRRYVAMAETHVCDGVGPRVRQRIPELAFCRPESAGPTGHPRLGPSVRGRAFSPRSASRSR